MTNQPILKVVYDEEMTNEDVKLVADKWNMNENELLDLVNSIDNEYPIASKFAILALTRCSDDLIANGITLKQSIGLIQCVRVMSSRHDVETNTTTVMPKYAGNVIKNIIQKATSIENIINMEAEEFGVYMLHKVKMIKDQLEDENSVYNQIVKVA